MPIIIMREGIKAQTFRVEAERRIAIMETAVTTSK
jgi:hypothetical protein